MNLRRDILHYQDSTSDKVYIVEINQLTGTPKPYVVVATWGKRSATRLNSQIKETFSSLGEANSYANKLVYDKGRGRDAYQKATKGLIIPGLNQLSSITAVQAGITNSSSQVVNVSVEEPTRRKIKL
jgi:predicted DNA-binding WGR domain protein